MKSKNSIIILTLILPILMLLGLPIFTVAQSYDEIVMVDPDDYRAYETSFNPSEIGWAWKNYLILTLICNDTAWDVYIVNTDGYYEFLQRERFGDISSNNFKKHLGGSYSMSIPAKITVNEETEDGFNPIYVIIYNDDDELAIWHIKISTSSEYLWWVSWWFISLIFVVPGVILVVFIVKKVRKRY